MNLFKIREIGETMPVRVFVVDLKKTTDGTNQHEKRYLMTFKMSVNWRN